MMSAYLIVVLVFTLVSSYMWLTHHFWLRHAVSEERQSAIQMRIVDNAVVHQADDPREKAA